jgi:hypothetical protein
MYFNPAPMADWYGVDDMASGQNIPYGGWGRTQPVFGEAYGADEKTVPYGYEGRTVPVYQDLYGAGEGIMATIQDTKFIQGALVGAAAMLVIGFLLRKMK